MWRGVVCTRWNLITGCIRDKALRSTIAQLPAHCSNHSSDKLINQNKCYGEPTYTWIYPEVVRPLCSLAIL